MINVINPIKITFFNNQSWWVKNFAYYGMLLITLQLNIKFCEFLLVANKSEYSSYFFESINWIFYLVVVNLP